MKHYGDITKINGSLVEPVNVVIGGSPCQDLSVAGKQAGLAGERSGLFMEQIRIIKEMRRADLEKGRTGKAPALRAQSGDNQPAIALENHPADSRVKIAEDGIVQTLNARMGTGGGNVPLVMCTIPGFGT